MIKRFLITSIYFLLIAHITVFGNNISSISANIASKKMGSENKMIKNDFQIIELGLGVEINGINFSVPCNLKELLDKGWKIIDKEPYFLKPLVDEDYYKIRMNWSLSKDKKSISSGGTIIRLLEKDGLLLEVKIKNQYSSTFEKIKEGIVSSMIIFYDKEHNSIKLNGIELSEFTPNLSAINKIYPANEGWQKIPTNYRDQPELGVSYEYGIEQSIDDVVKTITIYFDLENKPFKIMLEVIQQ